MPTTTHHEPAHSDAELVAAARAHERREAGQQRGLHGLEQHDRDPRQEEADDEVGDRGALARLRQRLRADERRVAEHLREQRAAEQVAEVGGDLAVRRGRARAPSARCGPRSAIAVANSGGIARQSPNHTGFFAPTSASGMHGARRSSASAAMLTPYAPKLPGARERAARQVLDPEREQRDHEADDESDVAGEQPRDERRRERGDDHRDRDQHRERAAEHAGAAHDRRATDAVHACGPPSPGRPPARAAGRCPGASTNTTTHSVLSAP